MQPVIALVGRPNVGKSTLFNRLTRSRDALVAELPGLTRDRKYGLGRVGDRPYLVVDTGGLTGEEHILDEAMARQTLLAVEEADTVLLMVDGRDGLTAGDEAIVERLRATGKPLRLVVNKTDGFDPDAACADFHALGIGSPIPIAALRGRGVRQLMEQVLEDFPEPEPAGDIEDDDRIGVAVVGRPNVGKSTLLNCILGEERLVAYDLPGTTRDSVEIPFERGGRRYTLIDTAGVRRRGKVSEVVEKFSIIKTMQAIENANVVVLVLDAHQGIADQDASLLGLVLDSGKAIVIAVNKWDGLDSHNRDQIKDRIDYHLGFLDFVDIHYISALRGSGIGKLFRSVDAAFDSTMVHVQTARLTQILEDAVAQHAPPIAHRRRIKLRYAHQGGRNPPIVVIHGTQTDSVPDAYRRYLSNTYRKVLRLTGTPVRIEFRSGENPYAGRKNKLTPRQIKSRRRLIHHVK